MSLMDELNSAIRQNAETSILSVYTLLHVPSDLFRFERELNLFKLNETIFEQCCNYSDVFYIHSVISAHCCFYFGFSFYLRN